MGPDGQKESNLVMRGHLKAKAKPIAKEPHDTVQTWVCPEEWGQSTIRGLDKKPSRRGGHGLLTPPGTSRDDSIHLYSIIYEGRPCVAALIPRALDFGLLIM
jgi:hypothetical protein